MGNTAYEVQNKCNECQPGSVDNENEAGQCPLKAYVKNHKDLRIKTFSDVQKQSRREKRMAQISQSNKQNIPLTQQTSQILSKQDTLRSSLSPNQQQNLPKNGTQIIDSKVKRNNEIQFKAIAISQQSFTKMTKQDPAIYYDFKEKIGEGSFGEVFRAVHKKSGQSRAIKVLKTKLMKEEQMKEFLSEMTLLSKLNHPSIITLYELFSLKDKYYVVMEYCRGGSIIKAIKRLRNREESIVATIMRQMLSALSYMHSLNIIHRDIKLDNIVFLNENDDCTLIKIIDFGSAVQSAHKLITGYPIAGTLSYLAPEVFMKILTEKSDVWSSAVLMYTLLTNNSLFKGKSQSETKNNILKKRIDFSHLTQISPQACYLLERMLNRKIEDRISAFDALHHPWLKQHKQSKSMSQRNLAQLCDFFLETQRKNNFISVIESYLSLRKITQQERQKLAAMFTNIDEDGSGQIDREELIKFLKENGKMLGNFKEQDMQEMVNKIDINNSGKIDFNEFIIAMYDKNKVYMRESLNDAFEHFDVDHTGYIEIGELKEMIEGCEKAEVEYFFNLIDKDNDSKISKEEFLEYILNY